jgi:hypothetical protein
MESSSRALRLHGSEHHESWPVPGAAFASGLGFDVSDETFGQARGKALAVAGDISRVIMSDDGNDRRMGFRVGTREESRRGFEY